MHAARHTAITDFLRFSGNLKLTQQLARHKDISTTANIYAHLDDIDLETALRRLHGGDIPADDRPPLGERKTELPTRDEPARTR